MEVYDGFEGKVLNEIWSSEKLENKAVEMQSEVVRSGQSAARITIRQGDRFEKADTPGVDNDTERDELLERKDLYSQEGMGYRYSFSIFIPNDFPIVPTRLVLAQWKQKENKGSVVINPLVALRYVRGELSITIQNDRKKTTVYKTKKDIKGKWLDFVFHIRFDRGKDGFVKAWLNGDEILNFKGTTAYSEEYGYENDGRFYFKMGLYRDCMDEPMTMYFDEYRKRRLREDELQ
jgi:hypothetical protein